MRPDEYHYRFAAPADAPRLAGLNAQLIADEGHRNRMTPEQLERRMHGWLATHYQAVLFEDADGHAAGYALFMREPEWVYLRHFLVVRERRRGGVGRAAVEWLVANAWADAPRVRIDVLAGNAAGVAFWRALGFADYCLTMERDLRDGPSL